MKSSLFPLLLIGKDEVILIFPIIGKNELMGIVFIQPFLQSDFIWGGGVVTGKSRKLDPPPHRMKSQKDTMGVLLSRLSLFEIHL